MKHSFEGQPEGIDSGVEIHEFNIEDVEKLIAALEDKDFKGEIITAGERDELQENIITLEELQRQFGAMPVPQEVNTALAKLRSIREKIGEQKEKDYRVA